MEKTAKTVRIDGKEAGVLAEYPVRFACMEHVEEELDEYVNEYETAPDTYKADSVEGDGLDKRCRRCGAPAQVALLRVNER